MLKATQNPQHFILLIEKIQMFLFLNLEYLNLQYGHFDLFINHEALVSLFERLDFHL